MGGISMELRGLNREVREPKMSYGSWGWRLAGGAIARRLNHVLIRMGPPKVRELDWTRLAEPRSRNRGKSRAKNDKS